MRLHDDNEHNEEIETRDVVSMNSQKKLIVFWIFKAHIQVKEINVDIRIGTF